jgi:hypothetical protein
MTAPQRFSSKIAMVGENKNAPWSTTPKACFVVVGRCRHYLFCAAQRSAYWRFEVRAGR